MSKNRIEAFTDAVIAIVMTLLVLELHQPEGDTFAFLLGVEQQFIIYLISFVMLAIYWNKHHHQFQVVMKPSPENIQELYLESLRLLGIDPLEHDIRFVEDNWENPSMGCAGLGWEVWLNGMEITQFTYFQQVGGLPCKPVTSEITYGLERLASYIQEVESVYDLEWTNGVKYGEIFNQPEYEHSKYSFEISNQEMLLENFSKFEKEAKRCIDENLVHPAYDYILKCSHTFNLLDARGAVSVTERAGYLSRIRNMAKSVAKIFVAERKRLGYPLLDRDAAEKLLKEDK